MLKEFSEGESLEKEVKEDRNLPLFLSAAAFIGIAIIAITFWISVEIAKEDLRESLEVQLPQSIEVQQSGGMTEEGVIGDWRMIKVNESDLPVDEKIILSITEDGVFSGGVCNVFEGRLSSPQTFVSTEMLCEDDLMNLEDEFFEVLSEPDVSFSLDDDLLIVSSELSASFGFTRV